MPTASKAIPGVEYPVHRPIRSHFARRLDGAGSTPGERFLSMSFLVTDGRCWRDNIAEGLGQGERSLTMVMLLGGNVYTIG